MRRLSLLALACLAAGVALLAYGAATGQGQVTLFIIFPMFTGTGLAPLAGMLLIVAAMFLWFASLAGFTAGSGAGPGSAAPSTPPQQSAPPAASPSRKFGGVVFLGPIPVVFGSDARVSKWMLVLAVIMTLVLVAFFFLVLTLPP